MPPSTAERAGEAGYALLEVAICVALLAMACVAALGAFPSLVRASQAQLIRSAALEIARNTLERDRAAAAYYPAAAVALPGTRSVATAGHAWALGPSAQVIAAARFRRAFCGETAPFTDVPMNVASSYDAAGDGIVVTVDYPPNPCRPAIRSSVTLAAQLAPAQYAPQTELQTAIDDPAYQ